MVLQPNPALNVSAGFSLTCLLCSLVRSLMFSNKRLRPSQNGWIGAVAEAHTGGFGGKRPEYTQNAAL